MVNADKTSGKGASRNAKQSPIATKMVTIDRADLAFVARPHRLHQSRRERVTFYNSTSETVRLSFFRDAPFEETGPYELSDGELLTLKVKAHRDVEGTHKYAIVVKERAYVGADEDESEGMPADDGEQEDVQFVALSASTGKGGSNPEMIID